MKQVRVPWIFMVLMVTLFVTPLFSQSRSGASAPVGIPVGGDFMENREVNPAHFFGVVTREDGSSPPTGAEIELDCHGYRTREASVDLTGSFAFQIGGDRRYGGLMPDASRGEEILYDVTGRSIQSIGFSTVNRQHSTPLYLWLNGCDLRAHLPGYRSSVHVLDGAKLEMVNNVGHIVLYPVDRVAGTMVSAASLNAPRSARSYLEQAKRTFEREQLDETEMYLISAIDAHPTYGEAHLLMGQLHQKRGHYQEARVSLNRAISTDPLYVNPYIQLGWLSFEQQYWKEVIDASEKALSLDPLYFPEAYFMSAMAYYHMGNLELAERRAIQTQQRDADRLFPKAHLILANIYYDRNEPEASIREMRLYLRYAPEAADSAVVRERLEAVESFLKTSSGS
jgi:tetratricopeptide (TPR) repeat protein